MAHPVRNGPGPDLYAMVNGAAQYECCGATSRNRDNMREFQQAISGSVLNRARQAVSFHLSADLGDVVAEHHDVMRFTVHIPHVVTK
jgi:hypothetical protein